MKKIFKQTYKIRNFDVDFNGKLKLEMLLDFLQDSAAEHARSFGLSGEDLLRKNLAWILSRYHIQINQYPQRGETIEVKTWPSQNKGVFTLREYEIRTSRAMYVQATSSWMAVDIQRKKPVNIKKTLPDFPVQDQRAVRDDFKSLPDSNRTDIEMRFPVLKSDLDFNRHVNNAVYIHWAVEAVPKEVVMNLKPSRIEANYKNETFYGEWVTARTQKIKTGDGPCFIHKLVRDKDEKDIARLRTEWSEY